MKKTIIALLLLVGMLGISCGFYSFSGSSLVGVETVYIPIFGNNTAEFGVEEQLTDALVDAINKERNLSVGERGNSDAIMEGRITGISDSPLTYTSGEQVTEYKVSISAHVKFEDVEKRKVIMEGDFSAFSEYDYPGGDRDTAISQAVTKLAQEILNKAVSGW